MLKMWDWIFSELKTIEKRIVTDKGVDKEDVIQNVCLYLCQNQKEAERLFETKNVGRLYIIVKHEIYNARSQQTFKNKVELSRYQRIAAVCKQHNIEMIPENAYKIYAMIDNNKWNDFSISGIITLLSVEQQEKECTYGDKIETFEGVVNI